MSQEAAEMIADSLAMLFEMTGIGPSHFVLATAGESGQNIFTSLSPEQAGAIATQVAAVLKVKSDERHPDDLRVFGFADLMIEKLNKKRAEGRDGWHDEATCPIDKLRREFDRKILNDPTDYLDVAILAMMLHIRGIKP